MNLHYSQTQMIKYSFEWSFITLWIYTILKLCASSQPSVFIVLLPYEFTLFSNLPFSTFKKSLVLLPYEFTLFSNSVNILLSLLGVLLPYEFTLFSNQEDNGSINVIVLLPYEFTLFSNHDLNTA